MQPPLLTLSERLKVETASAHKRLEHLPFFAALRAARLPTRSTLSFLHALAIIHGALEQRCAESGSPLLATLLEGYLPKVPLLARDLEHLEAVRRARVPAALQLALAYADELVTESDDPLCLIGPLYVLEGSQRGGLVLKRSFAQCLGIPEGQLVSIGCYGEDTQRHWEGFTAHLDALTLAPGQAEVLVCSASRCFERIAGICCAAFP
jgi:heme oxygenase